MRKPHNNLFPPANFGARLLGCLSGQRDNSQQPIRRRRAFTDVEDLLEKDFVTGGQKGEKNSEILKQNLNIDTCSKLDKSEAPSRKRELKEEEKKESKPFNSIVGRGRGLSLDLDYRDKIKQQDLKNLMQEKFITYVTDPKTQGGNSDARRKALGFQANAKKQAGVTTRNRAKKGDDQKVEHQEFQ